MKSHHFQLMSRILWQAGSWITRVFRMLRLFTWLCFRAKLRLVPTARKPHVSGLPIKARGFWVLIDSVCCGSLVKPMLLLECVALMMGKYAPELTCPAASQVVLRGSRKMRTDGAQAMFVQARVSREQSPIEFSASTSSFVNQQRCAYCVRVQC